MDWRTELQVSPSKNKISLSNKIFTIGSCFSDEIGDLLTESKFQVSRPFGTVYNPVSIHQLLNFALNKEMPSESSYAHIDDIFFNYHFHSSFSSLHKEELITKIRKSIFDSGDFLQSSNRIIITYGTAFVYQLRANGEIVANCHKIPSVNYEKRLLTGHEILKSFEKFYSLLKSVNPSAKIILTVSPVRHLKDTLELNSVSKSILRLACHFISNQFDDVEYFPAYEILLDDLRDYRFYKTDLLHPTKDAVEYIWKKFSESYFDESAKKFVSEWVKVKSDLEHKSFQPKSGGHQKFLKSLLMRLENFQKQVDVSQEIAKVKSQMI